MACDPAAELWPASFRGVPFWVMSDDEGGGRRLVIHEFPMRDDPFNEDLGSKARTYDVTAYLASEFTTSEAGALTAAMDRRGAGTLVLPTHGPLQVKAHEFKRSRERDRLGYIAYTLSFVVEGAATALFSAASLANLIFAAADGIGAAVGIAYGAALDRIGVAGTPTQPAPDYIRAAALDGLVGTAAALDVIRTDNPVDPGASLAQGEVLAALIETDALGLAADPAPLAAAAVEAARALGDGLDPELAATAFLALADAVAPAVLPATASVNRRRALDAGNAGARLLRIAALTAYAEALARRTFSSRREGVTARADLAEYLGAEIEACFGGDDLDLAEALEALRNAVVAYLSTVITTLAPIRVFDTPIRLPALVLAYRLYGDPARTPEIIDRNAVRVPSRVPTRFEGLAY